MPDHYDEDLDPVTFITVGTEGPPGQRTFFLQAARLKKVVTLVIEKEPAAALSLSIQRLLSAVDEPAEDDESATPAGAMDLLQPVHPDFRVGQIGIGVDEDRNMIVLIAEEMATDDDTEVRRIRIVASFAQMAALSRHTMDVVGQGRPVCELCGEPIEQEGHFCPRRNGHPPPLE